MGIDGGRARGYERNGETERETERDRERERQRERERERAREMGWEREEVKVCGCVQEHHIDIHLSGKKTTNNQINNNKNQIATLNICIDSITDHLFQQNQWSDISKHTENL